MRILLYGVEVFLESKNPFRCDFLERCHLITIDFKILQTAVPVTPIPLALRVLMAFLTHLTIIVQEEGIGLILLGKLVFASL